MGKNCSYSNCICDIPELNHKPKYKKGQIWKLYAGFRNDHFKIILKRDHQLVCENQRTKEYLIFSVWPGQYANCGTPQLRTLISGV